MLGRPSTTILLIAAQRLARADFSRGKLVGFWQEPRPDFDDLPSQVEAALALGPKTGRRVWVLCSDLWTQALTMPARTTAKLADADLARALGFELETLSGTNALDSVVAQVPLPTERQDERGYWVVQVSTAGRDQIDELIRRAGGRFMGITHPGGVPRTLGIENRESRIEDRELKKGERETKDPRSPILDPRSSILKSWQRIELWPDVIVCLHGEEGQPVRTHLINADPKQERWHAEEEAWRSRVGQAQRREMLLTSGELVTFDETGQPLVRQEEQGALQSLLAAWAEELTSSTNGVPLVRPATRPLSPAGRGLIAAGIALAVACLCAGFHQFANRSAIDQAKAEVQKLRQPVQQINTLTQQAGQIEKELSVLKKDLDGLRQTNDALKAQRHRLPKLLTALAEQLPEDLLVQKIDGSLDQPAIHGLCLGENQANQLATRLARALPDWHVQETKIKAKEKQAGVPYEFTILLKMPALSQEMVTPEKR